MSYKKTAQITRRDIIGTGAGLVTALALTPQAEANPLLRYAAPYFKRAVLFVGGLIVDEIILGTLKGFDIDIGETFTDVVRSFRGNDYPRQIRNRGHHEPQRHISPLGQGNDGYLQVATDGYIAGRQEPSQPEPQGHWVSGHLLWAAIGPETNPTVADLSSCRCGYPVEDRKVRSSTRQDFKTTMQDFEGGLATVVVRDDAVIPGDEYRIESLEEQSMILDWSWKPRRV